MIPILMVHGGAKAIPAPKALLFRAGCLRALEAGWEILKRKGSAIEAVEAAIRVLEDDPTFNAGYGAELNADGEVQMDAALMDGESLKAGAIGFIQGVRHPISIARLVLEQEEVFLTGDGARRLAEERGAELCEIEDLISPERCEEQAQKQREQRAPSRRGNDTVGCVALDFHGNLAAGGSTGGTGGTRRGRVGDTPLVGCGLYADNTRGACAFTGEGEQITRLVLAKAATDMLCGDASPDEVARRVIERLESRVQGEAGCILIDCEGRPGWSHNSANMSVAYINAEMDAPRIYLEKQEERLREDVLYGGA